MESRELPLGNPDFRKIREKDQYYVDKSLLIEEFLRSGDEVTLITRPRRFVKTLNMSMLSCFCDQDMDSRHLFDGLAIMKTAYAGWLSSFAALSIGMFFKLFQYIVHVEVERFVKQYSNMLSQSLIYHDTASDSEAIYHALFLGMCMTLSDYYHVTSNREYGDGRPDIRMESRFAAYPHVVVEFKKRVEESLQQLSENALQQIKDKNYTTGLEGKIICLGLAHSRKKCAAAYEVLD